MVRVATRTKRIEMRADPESEARIARAAALKQQSISAFVLGAAGREADRVLSHGDQTIMSATQFDDLMTSLDVADDAPSLRKVARAPRSFERR
jgi:uncharacterized protein (DUF1778 family)